MSGVRHHLEQMHSKEADYKEQLAALPLAPSKKARAKSASEPQKPLPPPPPPNPHSGMFTHGYILSGQKQPYRPRNRPVDALYFLNILATSGLKTHQARASERLLVNALLNPDFIRKLQETVNSGGYDLDLFDEEGMIIVPDRPVRFPGEDRNMPFTKGDVDSAILKLANTLQEVGFGDGIAGIEGVS